MTFVVSEKIFYCHYKTILWYGKVEKSNKINLDVISFSIISPKIVSIDFKVLVIKSTKKESFLKWLDISLATL